MGGWLRNAGNKAKLSPASAGTWAELGKNILEYENILGSKKILGPKNFGPKKTGRVNPSGRIYDPPSRK